MIRRLLSYVKEYKKESILTPLSMIIEVAMEMVVPMLMASLVNDGINARNEAGEVVGDMQHIILIGVFMIVAALIGLAGGIMGGVFGAKASTGFAKNLRKAISELDYKPVTFIVSQRAASIRFCDKIIVLDDGCVDGIGTHDELLKTSETYREIYESQFGKEAANA